MPYIELNVNKTVEKELKETIKSTLGKLIEKLPGKSENWLMVNILKLREKNSEENR